MNKRIRKSLFWSLAIVLVGVLVLWDMRKRPTKEEEGKTFTVLEPAALTGEGGTVVSIVRSDFPELPEPVEPTSELTYGQVEEMVRKAVAMGDFEAVIHKAEENRSEELLWVVIKPNIVELKKRGSGVITDWRVVKALIQIVHEIVPKARITIAEGGAWIPPERTDVREQIPWGDFGDGFEVAGYRQLLEDDELAGIRLDIVDLNFDEPIETPVPGKWHARAAYFIPKTILDCDVLIDVPVLKITGTAGITAAMKNFVGIAPGMVYGWAKMQGYPPGSGNPGIPHSDAILDETIVDLTSLSGVDFCVVDAVVAMERAKTDEDGGRPVRMNTIVAGADVVAVDAVCARLMGMNPDDIEYVTLGHAKGLGVGRLSDIRVVGQRIDEVARRFEKSPADWGSSGEYAHYGQGNRIWLLKGPIPSKEKNKASPDPTELYPTPGRDDWSAPVYFHGDRIDLDRYYNDPTSCVVYAYAEFDAPKTEEAHLWVGSDEGMQVWINGKSVYRFEGARRHRLPNERVPIPIRKGRNTCLVEATQTRGRYDFSLKVCEPETDSRYDGNTVFGLKYYVPKTAASRTKELAAVDERPRSSEWYEEHTVDVTQPGRGKLSAFLPGAAEAPWIGLDAPMMWGKKMEVQAQVQRNRITIRTENVRRFHLKMEGPLEKALRSLKMDVDGFSVRVKKATPGDRIGMEADFSEDGKVKGWSAKKRKEAPEDQTLLGAAPVAPPAV